MKQSNKRTFVSALTATTLVAALALSACKKQETPAPVPEAPATTPVATETAPEAPATTEKTPTILGQLAALAGRWEICVDQSSEVYEFGPASDPNYQAQITMVEAREYAGANCTGEFQSLQLDAAAQQAAGAMLAKVNQEVLNPNLADYQLLEIAMQNVTGSDTMLGWIFDKANNQLIQTDLTAAQLQALTAADFAKIQTEAAGSTYRRITN